MTLQIVTDYHSWSEEMKPLHVLYKCGLTKGDVEKKYIKATPLTCRRVYTRSFHFIARYSNIVSYWVAVVSLYFCIFLPQSASLSPVVFVHHQVWKDSGDEVLSLWSQKKIVEMWNWIQRSRTHTERERCLTHMIMCAHEVNAFMCMIND